MEKVIVEQLGPVRVITINRPERMNALDDEANARMIEAFADFEADPEARVAVVTGAGDDAFCAGADLVDFSLQNATVPAPEFRMNYVDGVGFGGITRNYYGTKPIIAAVNGFAISGGLEIAVAADIRLCSDTARFGFQDVRWGFHCSDGGSIRLPLIVGHGNAMEMLLSGDLVDAEHALRIGLVTEICPASELRDRAIAYAEKLATRAPLAQRFAKDYVTRSIGMYMDEAFRMEVRSFYDLAHSADMQEGVSAFKERRTPQFSGK